VLPEYRQGRPVRNILSRRDFRGASTVIFPRDSCNGGIPIRNTPDYYRKQNVRSAPRLMSFLWKSAPRKPAEAAVEVLVFTPDDRFFSSLMYVTTQFGWAVRWVKSVDRALEILERRTISILIYDCYPAGADWVPGVARFMVSSRGASILLAAPVVNEDIWERALSCGVYDVICRTGHGAQLASTLRFASKRTAGRLLTAPPTAVQRRPVTRGLPPEKEAGSSCEKGTWPQ
jgi:hypothetical protein